jgi:hypothetical protein
MELFIIEDLGVFYDIEKREQEPDKKNEICIYAFLERKKRPHEITFTDNENKKYRGRNIITYI